MARSWWWLNTKILLLWSCFGQVLEASRSLVCCWRVMYVKAEKDWAWCALVQKDSICNVSKWCLKLSGGPTPSLGNKNRWVQEECSKMSLAGFWSDLLQPYPRQTIILSSPTSFTCCERCCTLALAQRADFDGHSKRVGMPVMMWTILN